MPRAKAVSDEIKPKRATASRAPRRVSAASSPTSVRRKAPTVIPASNKRHSIKSLVITLGLFMVVMAGSAFVGMADTGEINVSGVIQERGATLRQEGREEEANQLTIPKDDGTRQPNGGLRPQTGEDIVTPAPAPATLGAEDSNESATTSPEATTAETTDENPITETPIEPEAPTSDTAAPTI